MFLVSWMNKKIKKFDMWDISAIKLSTIFFALLIAKFFPEILNFDWYWYVILMIFVAFRPLIKMFEK